MRPRFDLGRESVRVAEGFIVRLTNAALDSVVFVGFPDMENETITPTGTAFFFKYQGALYLITAKHVARGLGDFDWVIRINRHRGASFTIQAQPGVKWIEHPDENVDIAVLPFEPLSPLLGARYVAVPGERAITKESLAHHDIGVGDTCYSVGLFRVLQGQKRNLPVVHTGNIAMIPRDELVPIRDWDDESRAKHVEAYLVESQGLAGLSGSPVFVRPTLDIRTLPIADEDASMITVARPDVYLLGVFQGAWDAPPSEILMAGRTKPITVPVGMGIVVPAFRIIELLETADMKKGRDEFLRSKGLSNAASLTSASPEAAQAEPEDTNRHGKEDFMSLLRAAATKNPQGS